MKLKDILLEGRMSIRGTKTVSKMADKKMKPHAIYYYLNKLGYKGKPNSSDDPNEVDFLVVTRMRDGASKVIMKLDMANDPLVKKFLNIK